MDPRAITDLLQRVNRGDAQASSELAECVYGELHRQAEFAMRKQSSEHTLQPSALVNEVYLRIIGGAQRKWVNSSHFISVAAKAMRQVLVDHARAKNRSKRAAPGARVPIDLIALQYEERAVDIEQLDQALSRLNEFDPEMAQAIECRFFGDMPMDQIAETLGLAKRTLERRLNAAKAWVRLQLT